MGLPRFNFRVQSLGLKFDVPFLEKFRGRLIKKAFSVRKKLLRTNDAHVHCMWLKCKLDLRKAGGSHKCASKNGGTYSSVKFGSEFGRADYCTNIECQKCEDGPGE